MEEPSWLIRWVIYLVASGDLALTGAIGLAVAAAIATRVRSHVGSKTPGRLALFSLLLMACGSLVMPAALATVAGILCALVLFPGQSDKCVGQNPDHTRASSSIDGSWRRVLINTSLIVWIVGLVAVESVAYRRSAPREPLSQILVIGDSVTAGLNDGEDTWPRQLARGRQIELLDASQPGATLRSARQQNRLFAGRTGLLILEIGGNDLLEGLPVPEFERRLDELLSEVVQPGRTVLQFELPLPPFSSAYGVVQRRLAAKYDIRLLPKRRFVGVLTTAGATVDGIHLSARGQTQMEALVTACLPPQLSPGPGAYQHRD